MLAVHSPRTFPDMQNPANLNTEPKQPGLLLSGSLLPDSLLPRHFLIGGLMLSLLCSCGNRGPLYLPAKDQDVVISQPATETESEQTTISDEDDSTDDESGQ
jgi:predicted small lipoprotein YifL